MIDYLIYKFFGFRVDCYELYHRYVRDDEYGFTHIIDIIHKANGKHLIQSYSLEDTISEGSLCVGIDIRMLFLLWLKSVFIRWKWRRNKNERN